MMHQETWRGNSEEDLQDMANALSEVCGGRRYQLTEFEGKAWSRLMMRTPKVQFLAFLSQHMMSSDFAPTIAAASSALGLTDASDPAWLKLVHLVSSHGPYSVPAEFAQDDVLRAAVLALGGWQKVNETMPDASQDYAYREYRERFVAAHQLAVSQVRMQGRKPEQLRGIGVFSPTGLLGHEPQEVHQTDSRAGESPRVDRIGMEGARPR